MASPAFIYAFDNLGEYEFTRLVGLLLGNRFPGFLRGGVGADGGVDGETGQWVPETMAPVLNQIYRPGEKLIFQFKYICVARAGGEVNARKKLEKMFTCKKDNCELHKALVLSKNPSAYIVVTNLEISSIFRDKFTKECKTHQPLISRYDIIGLDDLEGWVTTEPEIRSMFFPTIFGQPRFNLKITTSTGVRDDGRYIFVTVSNIGMITSHLASIHFEAVADGRPINFSIGLEGLHGQNFIRPDNSASLEVGRSHRFGYTVQKILDLKINQGYQALILVAVVVTDEIGYTYRSTISIEINEFIKLQRL